MNFAEPHQLSDDELLERIEELVKKERVTLVELLTHLAEIDARKLYLEQACPSMFVYCTARLHFSEWAAYNRIAAVRAARRFPVVLEKVRAGELHLSGLTVLAPHLTLENHLGLLASARHKSKRAIEELVADLHPKAEVSTVVRSVAAATPPGSSHAPTAQLQAPPHAAPDPQSSPTSPPPCPRTARRQLPVSTERPLGDKRYRLHLTLPSATYAKLQEARALLRHQIPDGDLAALMDQALTLLLEEVKKRRFGLTEQPHRSPSKTACRLSSRYIPADVRRQVFRRDGGRCTYVDAQRRRCEAREFLEFHHVDPWARGHHHDPDRIVLLCRAHNQRLAETDFGRIFMEERRERGGETDCPRGQSGHGVSGFR